MFDDVRIRRGRGRLETKLVTSAGAMDGSSPAAGANGARVALLFAATPNAMDIASYVVIGPRVGSAIVPVRVLVAGIPHCALTLQKDGDIVMGEIFALNGGGFAALAIHEVIWHPEEP